MGVPETGTRAFAGTWRAANPQDTFWLGNPDHVLRRAMLVREGDYRDIVEPRFEQEIRSAGFYRNKAKNIITYL